jgi:RNA polymerase sigma factor (sigma-70 family)
MVLGVCRRVLHNAADADDAFQATFLVLVRKAKSIRKGELVGCWLHGVAFRVAWEAKIKARPQPNGEMQDRAASEPDPSVVAAGRELRSILDQELEQLHAKYRWPLVLHYLEGKTKEEIARQLGWTEGTVSGRLARARELLRKRRALRNLLVSEGMLAAILTEELASAAVPMALANATRKSALLVGASAMAGGAATGASHALAEAALKTMFVTKLKHVIPLAVVLVAVATGLGVAGYAYRPVPPADNSKQPEAAQQTVVVTTAELTQEQWEAEYGTASEAKDFAEKQVILENGRGGEAPVWDREANVKAKDGWFNKLAPRAKDAKLDKKTGHWTVTGTMNKLEVQLIDLLKRESRYRPYCDEELTRAMIEGKTNWKVVVGRVDGKWRRESYAQFWTENGSKPGK